MPKNMRITKIDVKNFRLLKNVTVDMEEELSLIIGKNNCGKTSLLLVLDKFLGDKSFYFDDFNADYKEELKEKIENDAVQDDKALIFPGISLKLFIEYNEDDDLSNIGNKVMMDLDPDNKVVVLGFEYYLSEEPLAKLIVSK
jgi:putative ATP-dependent endonuclease of the OLD family